VWLKASASGRALRLATLVIGGGFAYLAILFLFGVRPRALLLQRPGAGGQPR
jgi:hypothetical protein